ncbi:ABC transporter ATP-binding protein [Nonomuraea sp. NPDC049152]|uniref:ABC transporter ATP-binding protein n=1 Tax=Nonomuraea sp. NPDC049152 TaxID=3154350 RepID=UPI0033D7E3F6
MLIRLLKAHLLPHRRALAALAVLQTAQTVALLYLPALNAALIDDGVFKGDLDRVFRLGGVMLAVTLAQAAGAAVAIRLATRTATAVGRDVRAEVFAKVQGLSGGQLARFGTASLITRTVHDVQQVQQFTLSACVVLVPVPIMCVGAVALALGHDAPLSATLLVMTPLLGGALALVVRGLRPLSVATQLRVDHANRILREQITGIRVIRAFVREEHERRRFETANHGLADLAVRTGRLQTLLLPLSTTVVNVFSVAVVWFGATRVGAGELIAFLAYLTQIVTAVTSGTVVLMTMPRAEVCAGRIREVLDTEEGFAPPAVPVRTMPARGRVEVRAASFTHPGSLTPALRGVDLVALPGETTAVIGPTGSGKSTLLALVPRLLDATGGQVLVGGVDVRELDPALLSATVALVPQRPFLFSGTVASTLRYGTPQAADAELWHALEVAQARDFVRSLDHPVTQGGANLSGGQRQRLTIAGAVLRRPEIYLFDDCFSALDRATEAALLAALAEETRGATVVVVAQRVSAVMAADHVVVMDAGRVAGAGTHDELLRDGGVYREIALSQEPA